MYQFNVLALRLWKIAYKLHVGFEDKETIPDLEEEDWFHLLRSQDTKGRFHDRLLILGDSESYYLLTALANMAIVRNEKEKTFIDVCTCLAFWHVLAIACYIWGRCLHSLLAVVQAVCYKRKE